MAKDRLKEKLYYFIDIELNSRKIIHHGTELKSKVAVDLGYGHHRVFLTQGQYNKFQRSLEKQ